MRINTPLIVPHKITEREHRGHLSPHRSSEKACKPSSRNPTQHSKQRLHAIMVPMAAPHGELDTAAFRPHKTCWIPHGNSPAHTGEGENTFHDDKDPKHKAHRRQDKGKGTLGEYPRARGNGSSGINGAWILPRNIFTFPRNTEHAPKHHDVGRPHTPQSQQDPLRTPRAPYKNTHREYHLPLQQSQDTRGARAAGREPPRTHTTSQPVARTTYPPFSTLDLSNSLHHSPLSPHLIPTTKPRPP